MGDLTLKALAIGSLPSKSAEKAMDYIFNLYEIPFWAQLAKVNRLEDMTTQYLQNIPGIEYSEDNEKFIFNQDSETFFEKLEEFYLDYEEITANKNYDLLEKYAITSPYSSTLSIFFERLSNGAFNYAKGHITGPFTLGASISDKEGKCALFDDTLKDIVNKGLALKALWQIVKMKESNNSVIPIIFIDEPALSQYGTSAFVTVQRSEIVDSLKEVSDVIKSAGGISAVHCCGKGDWGLIIESGINMLNLDGYSFASTLSIYAKEVGEFLNNGGYIAWGIIPTLDKDALESIDISVAEEKFEDALTFLIKKGIDKNLIIKQSLLTPSCGAGSLSTELAKKAMELNVELSEKLQKKYSGVCV